MKTLRMYNSREWIVINFISTSLAFVETTTAIFILPLWQKSTALVFLLFLKKRKKPIGNAWGGALNIVLRDIGENYDEPMWLEWQDRKYGFIEPLESDSDRYVANRITEKQMQYEESDRYPTTMALRYGV